MRQTIEKRLINEHKYRREQIKIEFGLKLGSRRHCWEWMVSASDTPIWLMVVQLSMLFRYT
ncbi:MAG: type I restriction enzyme HsdR N-terminal domain-containing protein [Candidatus Poribacteria bacterium]|nr:type I restriction enzyme HsdR N-terminal domain-containing protein [Candidatus Poribacteria bacterium]